MCLTVAAVSSVIPASTRVIGTTAGPPRAHIVHTVLGYLHEHLISGTLAVFRSRLSE